MTNKTAEQEAREGKGTFAINMERLLDNYDEILSRVSVQINQLSVGIDKQRAEAFKDRAKTLAFIPDPDIERARTEGYQRALEVINSEPELPGDMPDEMWEAIRNDRNACAEAMRIVVRQTKSNIINNLKSKGGV